ncbi:hypothetical protein EWM64_g4247 [Hericium alpestre]|uniref:Uncharacterized protein n=1 Tax=Hericium alpestre TaxID=135208 RepID=A0A4Z0A0B3_9AGAM|nr:hypothetical protein EWM64_g4247 [Hericium alpestre]
MSPKSSRKPKFAHPEHFTSTGRDRWTCNVCTPADSKLIPMAAKQASNHERSLEHVHEVDRAKAREWATSQQVRDWDAVSNPWAPVEAQDWAAPAEPQTLDEKRVHERYNWMEMSPEVIGFWRRGVEAAEKGEEVERMQGFLERLEADRENWKQGVAGDSWDVPAADNDWAWGAQGGTWGQQQDAAGWGTSARSGGRRLRRQASNASGEDIAKADATSFVEKYARRRSLTPQRQEEMQEFFEMPTQEKVAKIQEVIRSLRVHI